MSEKAPPLELVSSRMTNEDYVAVERAMSYISSQPTVNVPFSVTNDILHGLQKVLSKREQKE